MLMPSASVQSGQFQCSATQQAGCLGLFVIPFPSQKCIHYERYQLFVIPTERSFFRALIHLTRRILGNVRCANQSDSSPYFPNKAVRNDAFGLRIDPSISDLQMKLGRN